MLAGLLSTMNVWATRFSDIRISLNDIYMSCLMTGWMFLFMGLVYQETITFIFGTLLVVGSIWCIRTQFYITQDEYIQGMIPHHSMAVHMSQRLLEKQNTINTFLQKIIKGQNEEIEFMKRIQESKKI
jgi:Domain of unknown function (DUF305)